MPPLGEVVDVGEEVTERRIGRESAPASAAERAGEHQDVALEAERRVQLADPHLVLLEEVAAKSGVPGREVVHLVLGELDARQRRRLQREGLRGRGLLAGDHAGRDGTFFHAIQRRARDAVEAEQDPHLGDLRHGRNGASVAPRVKQDGGRGGVEIPQIVMDELLKPFQLAGGGVERDQAVAVEIVAVTVRAIEVRSGRAQRNIGDSARNVHRDEAPGVGAGAILPAIGRPRIVAGLTGTRHGVERPHQLAGASVPGADVAVGASAGISLAVGAARDDEVLVDRGRGLERESGIGQVAEDALLQIQKTLVGEAGSRLPVGCIEGDHAALDASVHARMRGRVAGPVGETAQGNLGGFIVPKLFAGFGLDGEQAIGRRDVHDATGDDRDSFGAGFASVKRPCLLEPRDVA